MPTSAGDLRERVGFYQRIATDDGYGNTENGYPGVPSFTVAANIKPRLGGEEVLAGRLQGKNFVNITVRWSAQTSQVTADWRLKDERAGVIYNIRSVIDPDQKRRFIELLCEKGVAT